MATHWVGERDWLDESDFRHVWNAHTEMVDGVAGIKLDGAYFPASTWMKGK